ncbi:MAG: ABC transporter permease [Fimbriimonadaceae bacterium]|nr:ABC transporter permease [Fimbriimonadaceae bacterium]
MRLAKSILVRLLFGLVSLVFISFVTFVADEITPGDAATIQAGEKARPEDVQNLRHQMGLDRPWLVRYVEFVGNAARFDFGRSYLGAKPEVSKIIGKALPMTLKIAFLAILLAAAVGIFLGTIAGVYQNKAADRGVLTLSTLGVTLPNFVLAPVLVYFFAVRMDVLPQTWEVHLRAPQFYYLLLPVIILSARPMASLTRLTRASVVDTLQQEFVRLATAKGVPPTRLVFRHVLRNALLPVITAIGTSFGFLLTGSFIIERAFLIPGLGSEAIEAILKRDTPVIQATVLVAGGLFILINLIVDLILPLLDPRIREAQV